MGRFKLIFTMILVSAVLVVASCSQKESQPAAPPPQPKPAIIKKAELLPQKNQILPPSGESELTTPTTPLVVPSDEQEETPAQLAAQVRQEESDYHNTLDFQKRVAILYNLSSVESPETIDAVGRLFLTEQDKELKIELLNSMKDIEGENDKKLTILSAAIRADQPQDVRLEAIDGMTNMEDKRAIQVLQGALNDPDQEIREAAQDAIEQLQEDTTQPQ
jgi:hypothetical protein